MPRNREREPVGTTIGNLTLLKYVSVPEGSDKGNSPYGIVRCSCGVEKVMSWKNIRSGKILSCGHLKGVKNKYKSTDENGKPTIMYSRWNSLVYKFKRKGSKFHKHITDNNIKLEWNSYQEFYEDMADSFYNLAKDNEPNNIVLYTHNDLDNYNKHNCYWGLKRVSFPITIYGNKFNSFEEISEKYDVPTSTLVGRAYKLGKQGKELIEA